MIRRREVISAIVGSISLAFTSRTTRAQAGPRIPDPASFQSGDFVWPKKPGTFVPYRYESGHSVEDDRDRWNREKAEFMHRVQKGEVPGGQQIASQIEALSYNEFRSRYLRGQELNQIVPFSGGRVAAVGHVGIIQLDENGQPWVIEALWEPGVVRQRYSSWINARVGEIVWHGRFKEVSQQNRAKIAAEAISFISKPYHFWNFDLADVSGFYCSKLVWLSVMKGLNVPVDGNPNPSRTFWLSPKQILYSRHVDRLLDPGDYAVD